MAKQDMSYLASARRWNKLDRAEQFRHTFWATLVGIAALAIGIGGLLAIGIAFHWIPVR